jgi:hypothetical protein
MAASRSLVEFQPNSLTSNDELLTPADLPESGSFHAVFFSPTTATNDHVYSPAGPPETGVQRLPTSCFPSFENNTLNYHDVQEVAPLASSSVGTFQETCVYGLPEENPLNRSEQPELPDQPTWNIEPDASRKENMLLTDQRGFR